MCGRFQLSVKGKHISERFNVEVFDELYRPSYNCAPSQKLPIITNVEPKKLNFFSWGLIPYWSKDAMVGFRNINTRSETINEKPSFKQAFQRRRCLIPSNGFYEWKKDQNKTPFRIFLRNEELFSMAGIWEIWKDAEDRPVNTFSIITTKANSNIKDIHNRMPVILTPKDEQTWLACDDESELLSLLKPYNRTEIDFYSISKEVNSPKNNNSGLIARYESGQGKLF